MALALKGLLHLSILSDFLLTLDYSNVRVTGMTLYFLTENSLFEVAIIAGNRIKWTQVLILAMS